MNSFFKFLFSKSGLICLDWYDWNFLWVENFWYVKTGRDWSVWIDTIETTAGISDKSSACLMSGLICLDWYDWNVWLFLYTLVAPSIVGIDLFGLIRLKLFQGTNEFNFNISMSGLICLDWYDWNHIICCYYIWLHLGRDWSVWIDTIETSFKEILVLYFLEMSGLICLDWYDWNQFIIVPLNILIIVGIDLFGLIRLKPLKCGTSNLTSSP